MTNEHERGKASDAVEINNGNKNPTDEPAAEYWLKALVESADDAIISKTLDGVITSWNKSAERIFGYRAEEAVGKSILMLIPPDQHGEEPAILGKIRRGERVEQYETVRLTKNGARVDVALTISPIKTPDGRIIGASKIVRDISDAKRAQERIQSGERTYRMLFNSIDEGFCTIDVMFDETGKAYDYRFLEINEAFIEQTGLTDAAPGVTMRELVPNHDESWFEAYGRVATTGEPIRFENYAEVLDIWFDLYAFRVGGADSRVVAVIFKNITARKRADEGLRKSDARLRLALDIARTSSFEIDLLTDKVTTDELGRNIYGFEKNEPLTFEKVQARFHPDDREYVIRSVSEAFDPQGSGKFEIEQRIVRTDGDVRWIRVLGRTFFEGEGEARRAVTCLGTYIDITRQKQDEQERLRLLRRLEAERSRLQYMFTQAPAFVAFLGGPEHVFEMTNPAYQQLIGHRNVIGKPVREALPEIEGQGFFELLDEVYRTGEPYIGREIPALLQREANGPPERRFIDIVYQPIFEDDRKVSGIFVHGVDITEQVEIRKEVEEANRAKDEFLATLSHELRTPLNAIFGWSKMLTEGKLDEKSQRRAVETIHRNAHAQTQLINDILDVSRIITGKLKLEVSPIELESVVESAVESVLPAAQAKDIRLSRVLDPGKSVISGDPNRLQQIIWNLLSNAVKFTPPAGRVEIRLARADSHVEIIVSDNGIGISPKILPHVFDRFKQADSATTRQHGGLGLGLAIVRHLVEMHGGTVEAESGGEAQGSTFTVKLPLIALRAGGETSESAGRAVSAVETDVPFRCTAELEGLHVLVVEDEEDGRILVATILEQCGAKIRTAASVREGLQAFEEERFDVLLSDIAMPLEDGYSLIQKVRRMPPEKGGRIPAAALTAYVRTEDRMKILRAGFQIHIPKPLEPAELVAVVANLAGRRV